MGVPVPPRKRWDKALKEITTASFNNLLASTFIPNDPFHNLLPTALDIHIGMYIYAYMNIRTGRTDNPASLPFLMQYSTE
jgi:hypothetical protein